MEIAEEKLGEKMNEVRAFSDEKLFYLCTKFGARALKWRGKFLGLLPEANRRRIFEKKGFNTIFEFAYRLAGLSEEQVRLVLRLDLKFEDKPVLKGLLVGGEVSVSKLARVASIATAENEQEWAEVVNTLPREALETLIRDQRVIDERQGRGEIFEKIGRQKLESNTGSNGLSNSLFGCGSVPGHGLNFQISEELAQELNELNRQGHDVNKLILGLLEKRRAEIAQRKEKLGEEAIAKAATGQKPQSGAKKGKSTYVSVKVKEVLHEEYGEKCSIPTCNRPAVDNHHSQRISIAGLNDPRYMAPMCKEHHAIAHLVDRKYAKYRKVE